MRSGVVSLRSGWWFAALSLALMGSGLCSRAHARPSAPGVVCKTVPDAAECAGSVPSCTLCHESVEPPRWNQYGTVLKQYIAGQPDFDAALMAALVKSGLEDSDDDGITNADELARGSQPGTPDDADSVTEPPADNPYYELTGYDARFAFRRVSILYCGRSPTFSENEAFTAPQADPTQLRALVHEQLTRCLNSEYWQTQALPRLADRRIRPLRAAGPDSQIFIVGKRLVIGDYRYDYRLWRYVLTEDRDMRELLTAQYHIVEAADGTLQKVSGVVEKADPEAFAGGQLVPDEHRAGMITTQWFFAINTMFSALPRTTAAQAYRAYLGADISMNQGLLPVPGEPLDIDAKGVAQERCANCHSTLDPLSYAFAEYEGIQMKVGTQFGAYNPDRIPEVLPAWDATKQQSVLLGKPVANVVEWGRHAATTDEFKRNMAGIFFKHALAKEPNANDQVEFQALWRSLPEDGYSANKLIHRLVDTVTFGGP